MGTGKSLENQGAVGKTDYNLSDAHRDLDISDGTKPVSRNPYSAGAKRKFRQLSVGRAAPRTTTAHSVTRNQPPFGITTKVLAADTGEGERGELKQLFKARSKSTPSSHQGLASSQPLTRQNQKESQQKGAIQSLIRAELLANHTNTSFQFSD